jgi:hypothetical protein
MEATMVKVFRKLKKARRKHSKASKELGKAFDVDVDAIGRSDSSSVASWGAESSLSGTTQASILPYRKDSSDMLLYDDESLPSILKADENAGSVVALVVYERPPPQPLPDSLKIWCKFTGESWMHLTNGL